MSGYQVRCSQPCTRFGSDRCEIHSGQEPFGHTPEANAAREAWLEEWQREVDAFLASCRECDGEREEVTE